ncbi:MAG: NAD(P)H-hydrate epimerase, partial [bacterium]
MWVVTAAQMRERDRWAIEEVGLPGLVLMENAGRQVAALARRLLDEGGAGKKAWIFAGKGNNGGDGLVAARYLARAGVQVETFLLAREGELRGDAAANLQICRQLGLPLVELHSSADLAALAPRRAGVDLIIDALLGTGIRGPVQGFLAEVISFINEGGSPVLAIDLPSGLEADTGACPGPVVKAAATVTLDLPKWGLCLYPGAKEVGRLWVADIGMPPGAPLPEPGVFLTTPRELADL